MNEKRWIIIIVLVIILFVGFGIMNRSQKSNSELIDKTSYIMGTVVNLSMYDDVDDEIFEGAFDVIRDIEKKMSLQIKDSELNKINDKAFDEPVELSEEMKYVLEKSIEYSVISDGYFDISIGPIVRLWGIGTEEAKVPESDQLKNLLPKVDYKNIEIKDSKIKLKDEDMIVDLGGIAKGYAADQVIKYLKSQNIEKAIIDLGGNIYALGTKLDDEPWTIGVQNPYNETRGDYLGLLTISDKSVVTSGVYERYLEEDDNKYHHILDPFTGYPVNNELMSVTIVSEESIDGDALSTAIFALGIEDGYKLVNSLNDVEAIFITKDKDIYLTGQLENNFKIKNKDFTIKAF